MAYEPAAERVPFEAQPTPVVARTSGKCVSAATAPARRVPVALNRAQEGRGPPAQAPMGRAASGASWRKAHVDGGQNEEAGDLDFHVRSPDENFPLGDAWRTGERMTVVLPAAPLPYARLSA